MTKTEFKKLAKKLGFDNNEPDELYDVLLKHHPKRAKKGGNAYPLRNYVEDSDPVIIYSQTHPTPRVNLRPTLILISAYWNNTVAQEDPKEPYIDGNYFMAYTLNEMPEQIFMENPVKPGEALDGTGKDAEYQYDFSEADLVRKSMIKLAIKMDLLDNSTREKRGAIIEEYFHCTDEEFEKKFNFRFARVVKEYYAKGKYQNEDYITLKKKNIQNLSKEITKEEKRKADSEQSTINSFTVVGSGNNVIQGVSNSVINYGTTNVELSIRDKVNDLLANDKISSAIELLQSVEGKDAKDSIVLIHVRHINNERDNSLGIISRNSYTLTKNQIIASIQSFVDMYLSK